MAPPKRKVKSPNTRRTVSEEVEKLAKEVRDLRLVVREVHQNIEMIMEAQTDLHLRLEDSQDHSPVVVI